MPVPCSQGAYLERVEQNTNTMPVKKVLLERDKMRMDHRGEHVRGWGHGFFNREVGEDLSEETSAAQCPEPWEVTGYLKISQGRGGIPGRWLSRGRGPKVRMNVELLIPRGGWHDCISWMEGKRQRAACPHYPEAKSRLRFYPVRFRLLIRRAGFSWGCCIGNETLRQREWKENHSPFSLCPWYLATPGFPDATAIFLDFSGHTDVTRHLMVQE